MKDEASLAPMDVVGMDALRKYALGFIGVVIAVEQIRLGVPWPASHER